MKLSHPIRSSIAVSLLLLFTLQAGLGLWWHNVFHQPDTIQQQVSAVKKELVVSASTSSISCTCVDDFLVPFTTVQHPVLPQAAFLFFMPLQAGFYTYLPESLRIFRSLRAPPAIC